MTILPWQQLLNAACRLGLSPDQFWALSVFEWRALMGQGQGLDPARLQELCQAFPDDAGDILNPTHEDIIHGNKPQ
jgi:uncharacterized phage protein (TIGR02216 family)